MLPSCLGLGEAPVGVRPPFGLRRRQAHGGLGLALRLGGGETAFGLGLAFGFQGGKALVRLSLPGRLGLGEAFVRLRQPFGLRRRHEGEPPVRLRLPLGLRRRQAVIGFDSALHLGGGEAFVRLRPPFGLRRRQEVSGFGLALGPGGGETAFRFDVALGPVLGLCVGGRVFLLLGFATFVFGDDAAQPLVGGVLLVLRFVGSQ